MKKIALIGAPSSGKTTIMSGLFYHFKMLEKKVEIVPELIKYKVYEDIKFGEEGFDIQNSLEQAKLEKIISNAKGIDLVICESPLCNGYFYSSFYKKKYEAPLLKKIAQNYINGYDLIIFVEHLNDGKFESFGRKESQETSLKIENHIRKELKKLNFKNSMIYVNKKTNIYKIINQILIELNESI